MIIIGFVKIETSEKVKFKSELNSIKDYVRAIKFLTTEMETKKISLKRKQKQK